MKTYALAILLASSVYGADADCSALAQAAWANTTVTTATLVAAGEFTPPGANQPIRKTPAFCRLAGSIRPTADSDIRFEVWLPLSTAWNRKFQGIGNGGYAGSIGYSALASAITHGYAAASTDTGHTGGGDAKWALHHPEKTIDFGHRAIHETAVVAKAAIRHFYGAGPQRSYFNSCSNGGRQALMEAQRYPEDYDGIIAGAPANYWTHLMTLGAADIKATVVEPGAYIPAAKLPAIQAAVQASCDKNDGVTDGVIEQPNLCRPNLDALACAGVETGQCLTIPQLKALRQVYAGVTDRQGKVIYAGHAPGGEAEPGGWANWITGAEPKQSALFFFSTQFFQNMVYSDPQWDFSQFDAGRDMKAADEKAGPMLNAIDPDLRKFQARGGKLILYHGWSDAAIPAINAIGYYQSVQKKMGSGKAKEFTRLFMVPGMQHCGGGSGPNSFGQGGPGLTDPERDINAALERWVEKGIAPERIVAVKTKGTAVERSRPLCAYPLVAHYKGTGSTDDAANFTCAKR